MHDLLRLSEVLPGFAEYMAAERGFSPKTVKGYLQSVRLFTRDTGDLPIRQLSLQHFISCKAGMAQRHCGPYHIRNVVESMKCLLRYACEVLQVPTMDFRQVKAPREPRRDVLYLNADELEHYLASVPLRRWNGSLRVTGFLFRSLAETLLATGMRISEALSLNRDSIDPATKEAAIVGKGGKPRTVFFTERALFWIDAYMKLRSDSGPALFVTSRGTRLSADTAGALFRRYAQYAGLEKRVTPHVFRHTTATLLLRNGCPIGYIKEILGHDMLQTTCRYYLGVLSKIDVKQAHEKYATHALLQSESQLTADRPIGIPISPNAADLADHSAWRPKTDPRAVPPVARNHHPLPTHGLDEPGPPSPI